VRKEMMKAAGKSLWHRLTRGDDGDNKALPQISNISSDKRCNNGRQEVRKETAAVVGNG
jgi:hypothetical protein